VAVPLSWRASESERTAVLADSGVDLVVGSGDLAHLLDGSGIARIVLDGPAADYEALLAASEPLTGAQPGADVDDLTMLIYSSGTTGQPKGAMHTHRTLVHGALRIGYEMRLQPGDTFYSCLPFFFAGAQSV